MGQSRIMMKGAITTIQSKACGFPDILRNIPDAPQRLFVRSDNWDSLLLQPAVAVVGSRKITPYGRAVTAQLAAALARAGVCIVSGLAIGVDAVAHRAALEAGGITLAVLAGGLDDIYPSAHTQLAGQIVAQGGAIISEYPLGTPSLKHQFIARNRLVSGLSRAILITEATEKSGTLHTARFALEQGRDVLAVPGNLTNPSSVGTNRLIQSGATLIATAGDIFHALGISPTDPPQPKGDNAEEEAILRLIQAGETDSAALLQQSQLSVQTFNQTITMLEITGKIRGLGNNQWTAG
jgi:DNA processing protein